LFHVYKKFKLNYSVVDSNVFAAELPADQNNSMMNPEVMQNSLMNSHGGGPQPVNNIN